MYDFHLFFNFPSFSFTISISILFYSYRSSSNLINSNSKGRDGVSQLEFRYLESLLTLFAEILLSTNPDIHFLLLEQIQQVHNFRSLVKSLVYLLNYDQLPLTGFASSIVSLSALNQILFVECESSTGTRIYKQPHASLSSCSSNNCSPGIEPNEHKLRAGNCFNCILEWFAQFQLV